MWDTCQMCFLCGPVAGPVSRWTNSGWEQWCLPPSWWAGGVNHVKPMTGSERLRQRVNSRAKMLLPSFLPSLISFVHSFHSFQSRHSFHSFHFISCHFMSCHFMSFLFFYFLSFHSVHSFLSFIRSSIHSISQSTNSIN